MAVTAHNAIDRLQILRFTTINAQTAQQHLFRIQILYQLQVLYQTFFPTELQHTQAERFPPQNHPNGHSDLELEVLQHIDDRLFPINEIELETAVERESLVTSFSIIPHGIGWANLETAIAEYLSDGWQFLLPLCTLGRVYLDHYETSANEWYEDLCGRSLKQVCRPEQIDQTLLHRHAKQTAPLRFLPLALNILNYSSGNLWIDEDPTSYETSSETRFALTVPNARRLHQHWKAVETIYEKVAPLIAWLEADLLERSNIILNLWNQCKQTVP